MVKLLLDGFKTEAELGLPETTQARVTCHHVNAHFSRDMADIGQFRWQKAFLIIRYCFAAIVLRIRHGVENFYYVPSPALKNPLIRDWIILLICRPFFKRIFLHWHAAGLGHWLEKTQSPFTRWLSHRVLDHADLSIAVSQVNIPDSAKFHPKHQALVYNGISDPFPEFTSNILPLRIERLRQRMANTHNTCEINVLYLSLCCKEKGLMDTLHAIHIANTEKCTDGKKIKLKLKVAGQFLNPEEEKLFYNTISELSLEGDVTYAGFLGGESKHKAFVEADIFCLPTYYWAEAAVPLVLIEAMACGLPMVASSWRLESEFYPPQYPGLVEPKNPSQIAAAFIHLAEADMFQLFRDKFLNHFTLTKHIEELHKAFLKAVNS